MNIREIHDEANGVNYKPVDVELLMDRAVVARDSRRYDDQRAAFKNGPCKTSAEGNTSYRRSLHKTDDLLSVRNNGSALPLPCVCVFVL